MIIVVVVRVLGDVGFPPPLGVELAVLADDAEPAAPRPGGGCVAVGAGAVVDAVQVAGAPPAVLDEWAGHLRERVGELGSLDGRGRADGGEDGGHCRCRRGWWRGGGRRRGHLRVCRQ
jgi:hypothetical protein